MTRLSVIIPGYNTPDAWWDRCLASVCAACGPDDEVLCVDDGSKVRPKPSVVDPRIRFVYLEKNEGQSAARSRALDEAQGEYVTFVDSDDEVTPDVYERCFAALRVRRSDVVLFGAKVVWVDEGLYKVDMPKAEWLGVLNREQAQELFDACLIEYVWNRVYSRDFLLRSGLRFPSDLCPGEDTVFNLNVMKAGATWQTVDAVGYAYYRYNGSSLSRYLPTYAAAMEEKARLWKEVFGLEMPDGLPAYRLQMLWDNMWRKGSPHGFAARWRFARQNGLSFGKMLAKQLVRRCLYVRPLRRWKIRKMYPKLEKVA